MSSFVSHPFVGTRWIALFGRRLVTSPPLSVAVSSSSFATASLADCGHSDEVPSTPERSLSRFSLRTALSIARRLASLSATHRGCGSESCPPSSSSESRSSSASASAASNPAPRISSTVGVGAHASTAIALSPEALSGAGEGEEGTPSILSGGARRGTLAVDASTVNRRLPHLWQRPMSVTPNPCLQCAQARAEMRCGCSQRIECDRARQSAQRT
mmetsp:Transcript_18695/g.61033  ORF Transcript_18695/g.61033 Transcript_18695/m.61033 type:complete len:215 (+) Transcript_18695:265-909(+)